MKYGLRWLHGVLIWSWMSLWNPHRHQWEGHHHQSERVTLDPILAFDVKLEHKRKFEGICWTSQNEWLPPQYSPLPNHLVISAWYHCRICWNRKCILYCTCGNGLSDLLVTEQLLPCFCCLYALVDQICVWLHARSHFFWLVQFALFWIAIPYMEIVTNAVSFDTMLEINFNIRRTWSFHYWDLLSVSVQLQYWNRTFILDSLYTFR